MYFSFTDWHGGLGLELPYGTFCIRRGATFTKREAIDM